MPQTLTEQLSREQQIEALEKDWATNPRWKGIKRGYSAADVVRLRGSFPIEHTLARRGAEKLWGLVNNAGDPLEAQKLQDLIQFIGRFEKKLHDLKLSRMVAIQAV